jgi:HEAT repeat protein
MRDLDVERLIGIVTSRESTWPEREQAVERLVEFGEPAVLPLIQAFERHSSTLLLEGLGRLRDPRAVAPLVATLTQENPHIRQAAATALGLIGDPQAIGPLIDAFRVESGDTEDITAWLDAAEALARIGEPALGPLIAALADEDWLVRTSSAIALGQLGDLRAVVPLIATLSDADLQVRLDATEALGELGDPDAIDAVTARLSDPAEHELVRAQAARALGQLIRGEVFAPLVSALDDPSVDVRCQALYALAESAGPAAVDVLLARTTDPNTYVRHAAVTALGRVGDESLIPLLEWIAHHDQGELGRAMWVREAARYAIEGIRKRHLIQPT